MATSVDLGSVHASLELDIKNFRDNIKDAQGQLRDFEKTVGSSVRDAQTTWRDGLSNIGRDLTDFGKAATVALTLPLTLFAKQSIDAAVTYDEVMNMIRVASGEGQSAIDLLTPVIEDFGTRGRFSVLQVAQAVRDMVKDGLTPAEIASGQLEAAFNAATGAGEGLYETQIVLSNAMASYGAEVDQAARYSDVLVGALNSSQLELYDLGGSLAYVAPVAANLGIEIEDLGTAIAFMGDRGIKGSMAGTTLRRALLQLSDPPKEAKEALHGLGVEIFDSQGKMKALDVILGDLHDALYGVGQVTQVVGGRTADQNERLKYLQKTYDSTLKSIQNYEAGISGVNLSEDKRGKKIDELNEKLRNVQGEMNTLNGIQGEAISVTRQLTDEQRQQALGSIFGAYAVSGMTTLIEGGTEEWGKYRDQIDNAGQAQEAAEEASQGLAYQVGRIKSELFLLRKEIGDQFEPVAIRLADALHELNGAWKEMPETAKTGIVVFGAFLAALGPVALILGGIAKTLAGEGVLVTGLRIIGTILGGITSLPILPIVAAVAALAGTFVLIAGNLEFLKNVYDTSIKPIFETIGGQISTWVTAFKPFFDQLVAGFQMMWDVFVNALQPAFDTFVNAISEQVLPMLERLKPLFEPLIPVLLFIATIIGGALFGAFTAFMALLSGFINALAKFIPSVIQTVGGVVEVILGIINIIAGVIVGLVTGDFQMLKDGWDALWNGMLDIINGVVGMIGGTVKAFVEGIINFFVELYEKLVGGSIIPDMVNAIIKWITTLDDTVIAIIVGMVANFIAKFTNLLADMNSWWTDLVAKLEYWKTELLTWGGNLAQSFVDGFGKLKDLLLNKAKEALENAKKFLKGESPPIAGPFRNIDIWGFNVGRSWAEGFVSGLSELPNILDIPSLPTVQAESVPVTRSNVVTNNSPSFNVYVGMYAGSPMEKRQIAKELNDAYNDYRKGAGL